MCWYFPLREKLRRLLSLPQFRRLLTHEFVRKKNEEYFSDVYDAPMWSRVMGEAAGEIRIVLQYCVDAFQAHIHGTFSVKPAEFIILSLPPELRGKTQYMLLHMLIPQHLKGQASRKYYDWAAQFEMNDLHVNGVDGVRVIVYGTSMDSPGRAELLQMQSHSAYYGCPHCEHLFEPGLGGPVFGGFRRFLGRHHPCRQRTFEKDGCTYCFAQVENDLQARERTTQTAFECTSMATASRPFRGHKGRPYMSNWLCFDWMRQMCDMMHDEKTITIMLLKVMVGQGRNGFYNSWNSKNSDQKHRLYCRLHDIFPEVHDADSPFPWRLTREEVTVLDNRVKDMWWPHYLDIPCGSGGSFWTNPSCAWKCKHKALILMVRC